MIAAFLLRLARDRRGISITELAFAAPLLTLFVTGSIDLGQGLSERFSLQQAVNRSLEMVQAGPIQGDANSNDVDYSFLADEAARTAGVSPSQVTLQRWLECDHVRQTDYTDHCDAGEETSRYLQLRVDKAYAGSFFLRNYPMSAMASVRIQ